jgi:Zn-dependent protease
MLFDLLFSRPALYAAIVVVIIGSIVLHELGHALTATWERDATPKMLGHLTWNPVVHMGWYSIILVCAMGIGWGSTPVNPRYFRHRRWGNVLVSFAGPAVNALLICVSAIALGGVQRAGVENETLLDFWGLALHYNVLLFLFNMVPIPPLDGFTVLEGLIDLGDLGAMVKRAQPFTLIIAIIVVNSGPFMRLVDHVETAVALFFGAAV